MIKISPIKLSLWLILLISSLTSNISNSIEENFNAVQLQPSDFAYGSILQTPISSSLYSITLTEAIYQGSVQSNLNDLRIFNDKKEIVPFILEYTSQDTQINTQLKDLSFFRVNKNENHSTTFSIIESNKQSLNQNAKIQKEKNITYSKKATDTDYIVDLRKFQRPLKSVKLTWDSTNQNQIIHASFATSTNLQDWTPLVPDAVLAKLSYQNKMLEQNKIEFPATKANFLKISFKNDNSFQLNSVQGDFLLTHEAIHNWTQLRAEKYNNASEIEFDAHAYFPIDTLTINLPQNTLLKVKIFSKKEKDNSWELRHTDTIYHLYSEDQKIVSPPIHIKRQSDRFWLLRVEDNNINLQNIMPTLTLGWVPAQLTFLAQGPGPFLLAYGNATAPIAHFTVLPADAQIKPATMGPQIILGGSSKLQLPPAEKPLPWKQWLLWTLLIMIIIFLAKTSFQLYKELFKK